MPYCLNRDELASLLDLPVKGDQGTGIPEGRLVLARKWIEPLTFLTYTLACILERNREADNRIWTRTLGKAFALLSEMYIDVQECDADFVDYMLCHLRMPNISLEEALTEMERRRREFKYDKALRY